MISTCTICRISGSYFNPGGIYMSISYDFHLHSDFSCDSDTPTEAMIERALSLGLTGICFTEHQDLDGPLCSAGFHVDFPAYFEKLETLRAKYRGRIRIGIGLEFGIQPQLAGTLADLASEYPFDFIIASQHFADGMDPYYPEFFEGRSERSAYESFFREQLSSLQCTDCFDTLGHLDYVVRYGPNRNRYYSYEAYAELIDPILQLLIERGKCLELNTGGLKYGLGEPNPCTAVLKRYRELGGELITIGSDAHAPQHIAFDFPVAQELLISAGFRYYTVFEARTPKQIRLI